MADSLRSPGQPRDLLALALAAALASPVAMARIDEPVDARIAMVDAGPGPSGLDLLATSAYDQMRDGGSDVQQMTLTGLVLDGRDRNVALAMLPAVDELPPRLAVEPMLRGLGLEPRVAEDGGWIVETPLGIARLVGTRIEPVDGVDFARLDALADMLAIDLRYDDAQAAIVATTAWPLVPDAVPAGVEVERPEADAAAPTTSLSYWRTEAWATHADGDTTTQIASDVGGGLAGGFWRARYEDDLDGSQRIRDYAWVRTHGNQRWLLGNQQVNAHPLLNSFDLSGAQFAWTNRPDSLYGSALGYGELVSGRTAPSSQLRGSGPPGGVAELMFDGDVVARISIPLDGRYEFRDVSVPRGTGTRIQVALYERGGLGAPVRIEDRSGQTSDQLLERGTVLHYAGAGSLDNPLDPDDVLHGQAAFYEGRYGLLPGLTLDVAGQRTDGEDRWLAGGVASLGIAGVYSGHLAREGERQGWMVTGEGQHRRTYWRMLAREEDAGFREPGSLASHERYVEAGMRTDRFAIGLIGRDIAGDYVSEPVRYVRPTLDWYPTETLSLSAYPDLEGDYQYSAQWVPGERVRLSTYLTDETDRLEAEYRLSDRWRLNGGRVDFQERSRHSLLLSRDRRAASDLGFSVGALESEGDFGYLATLDKQLWPGVTVRLQAYDDPLVANGPDRGPVLQFAFVADFAVTSSGLTGGNYRRNLVEMGGVSGDLGLAGDAATALAGTPIWVDGQLRAHIDESGRFHVRDLRPGTYRVQVDEGKLPIEMRLERSERWVEVRAGVVTPVRYATTLRLGFAGRALAADGQPLANHDLQVYSEDGSPLLRVRTDAWGYYRVDDLTPGAYAVGAADAAATTRRSVTLSDEFEFGIDLRPAAGEPPR